MAILKSVLLFKGKLQGMNAYLPKNRDESEGYILRKNGGPSGKKIAKLPSCELVRRNNVEFGRCSSAGKSVRRAIIPVKHLADMNLAPQFTALCRYMLLQDTLNNLGERVVNFSDFGHMMSGFNLNKNHLFDSVVRHPLYAAMEKNTATAVIGLPALQPGINLVLPWQQPMYRLIISLGVAGYYNQSPESFITPWYTAQQAMEAATVTLQLSNGKISGHECMVVAVGVEMGTMVSDTVVARVKNTGCAKILIAG